jgi:hypothetical protein
MSSLYIGAICFVSLTSITASNTKCASIDDEIDSINSIKLAFDATCIKFCKKLEELLKGRWVDVNQTVCIVPSNIKAASLYCRCDFLSFYYATLLTGH